MKNKNLIGIGTRVKFLTTPDVGAVTQKLGDGMVMVLLDGDDMEIPAFEEDLVREEDFLLQQEIAQYPIFKHTNTSGTPLSKNAPEPNFKPTLSETGVHVALVPIHKNGGEIERFEVILFNDTPYDIVYEFDMIFFGEVEWSKDGKMNAVQFEKMGELAFDDINDSPEMDVSVAPIYTAGVDKMRQKTVKIKPKQIVKNAVYAIFLQRDAHILPLFDTFSQEGGAENAQDLSKYTKDILKTKAQEKRKSESERFQLYDPVANVDEYARFVPEVDLHIEMLHDDPHRLTSAEIVQIQIKAFEQFLNRAIKLGVPRVHIIHGVGSGRLKEMIGARLRRHPEVHRFRNEYHERYGWGATEVLLGRY